MFCKSHVRLFAILFAALLVGCSGTTDEAGSDTGSAESYDDGPDSEAPGAETDDIDEGGEPETDVEDIVDVALEPIEGTVSVNQTILGHDLPNILKGMAVAADPANNRIFVSGIMTGTLGIVDATTRTLVDSFEFTDDYGLTRMVWDPVHSELWMIDTGGEHLWIVSPDERRVLVEADIGADSRPTQDGFPVRGAALDVDTQTFYAYRSDGDRVVVYNRDLQKQGEILSGHFLFNMTWDAENRRIVALSIPPEGVGEPRVISASVSNPADLREVTVEQFGARPPRVFALAPDGDYLVADDRNVSRLAPDGSRIWNLRTEFAATALAVTESRVGVLHKYGSPGAEDEYVSRISLFDHGGQPITVSNLRYESSRVTAVGDTIVVGNGGDGSLSFVSPDGVVETTKVGSAAEDVIFTPDGQLIVLNRLGGSQLIAYDLATGASRVLELGNWPVRMALAEDGTAVHVFSHFHSSLDVIDVERFERVDSIPLGVEPAVSDTLGDMAASRDGRLVVGLIPEHGAISIVDTVLQRAVSVQYIASPRYADGPGRFQGAVDGAEGRVFVYIEETAEVLRFDEAEDWEMTARASLDVDGGTQGLELLYYAESVELLLAGDRVIDPDTLREVTRLDLADRIVGDAEGVLYGQYVDEDGFETLVVLDSDRFEVLEEITTVEARTMSTALAFDTATDRFAITSPQRSAVTVERF